MKNPVSSMELFQTITAVPLGEYFTGMFEQRLFPQGNALLSTLFVQSISEGATVTVTYREATTGEAVGEDSILQTHATPAAGTSDKVFVSKIHNKPRIRVVVNGGSVTMGIYITVISSAASNLESSLFKNNSLSNLLVDSGSQSVLYDSVLERHFFARGSNGVQDVKIESGQVQTSPAGLNIGGRITEVTLNDTSWTALPPFALQYRNSIQIQNYSGVSIKINYTNVNSSNFGIFIRDSSERFYMITESIIIFGRSTRGPAVVIVEEIA